MSDIKEITKALIKFRNERDWNQFHNPKDLAVAWRLERPGLNVILRRLALKAQVRPGC